jgi:hypothetical protein
MTSRKLGTSRRRVDHECGERYCELILTLGPARPRGENGTPGYPGDWAALPLADRLAHYFGSATAAEAAYWHHRDELAEADRAQMRLDGERPARPVAGDVFEPHVTWPPPASNQRGGEA